MAGRIEKKGFSRRCPNHDDIAIFQERGKQEVLFGLVETVDFIEQENQTTGKLSFFSDFLQAFLVVRRGIKGTERHPWSCQRLRTQSGSCQSLADRKNHGRQHIGMNHATDNLSRTEPGVPDPLLHQWIWAAYEGGVRLAGIGFLFSVFMANHYTTILRFGEKRRWWS